MAGATPPMPPAPLPVNAAAARLPRSSRLPNLSPLHPCHPAAEAMPRNVGMQGSAPAGPAEPCQTSVEMRQATTADLPALAQLYAVAFEVSPSYRWAFTGDFEQPAPEGALSWLFLRRARMLLQRGCPLLVGCSSDGALVAAGGLVPFAQKPGQLDYVKNGILLWPLWYGWASLRRALSMDGSLASLLASGALSGVAGELSMIAVRPDMQARGVVLPFGQLLPLQ